MVKVCLCYELKRWVTITEDIAEDLFVHFNISHQLKGDKFPYEIKDRSGKNKVTISNICEENEEYYVEYSYEEKTNLIKKVSFENLAVTMFKNKPCYTIIENRKSFALEPDIEHMEDEDVDHIMTRYLKE